MTLIMSVVVPHFYTMTLMISINVGVQEHDVFFTSSRLKIIIRQVLFKCQYCSHVQHDDTYYGQIHYMSVP